MRSFRRRRQITFNNACLLWDMFLTDLPAGSINGTAAEPGPGTRVGVDTNSKLSIDSRSAFFDTGGVGYGNPGLGYEEPITRLSGLILYGCFNAINPVNARLVWNTSASSGNYPNWEYGLGFVSAVGLINLYKDGVYNLNLVPYSNNYKYYLAIILRASGFLAYIKGGEYLDWTLIYVGDLGNTATLYNWVTSISTGSFRLHSLKTQTRCWLPNPLLSDGFGGTWSTSDGLGHAEGVAGGIGAGGGSKTWTAQIGTWGIAGGVALASALDGGLAIATVDISKADSWYTCVPVYSAGSAGVVVRYLDIDNYDYIINDGTNVKLFEVTTAAPYPGTERGTAVKAPAAGARLIVDTSGAVVRVYYNEAFLYSYATLADTTATKVGLFTTNINNTFDDVVAYEKHPSSTILPASNPLWEGVLSSERAWINSTNSFLDSDKLFLMISEDGLTWNWLLNGAALYTVAAPDNDLRDPDIAKIGSKYYVAFNNEANLDSPTASLVLLEIDKNLNCSVLCRPSFATLSANVRVWAPRWFRDDDGSWHIIAAASADSGDFHLYEIHPTADDLSTWSDPVQITGTALPTMIDPFVIAPSQSPDGKYTIWYKNNTTNYIEYMTSTSLLTGYVVQQSGDWAGWGQPHEGPTLAKIGTTWRLYFTVVATNAWNYVESADNWQTWSVPVELTDLLTQGCQFGHFKQVGDGVFAQWLD